MFKALIFDFDGLILDTETPDLRTWQEMYAEYGFTFPVQSWGQIIGGNGTSHFDAVAHLQELVGRPLDVQALQAQQIQMSDALLDKQPILPGVLDLILEAKRHALGLAVASSSDHSWVDSHLSRLGLARHFDKVICAEDVPPGRVKPNPDLFLKALRELHVTGNEAIAFEDSPNGVKAARSAGIFVAAVPNPTTSLLKFDGADLMLKSLADFNLQEFLH
jgi:HAD superfamily hydrolase (TIGR01509 family)